MVKKGGVPWNKGINLSDNHKSHISKGLKNSTVVNTGQFNKNSKPWNTGTAKNSKCKVCGKLFYLKKSKIYCSWKCYLNDENKTTSKGRVVSEETLRKMSLSKLGKPITRSKKYEGYIPWNYVDGNSHNKYQKLRDCFEYKSWREKIFIRDGYTCQVCKIGNQYIEGHHIITVKECLLNNKKEKIYDVTNGITLCKSCHKNIHSNRKKIIIKEMI